MSNDLTGQIENSPSHDEQAAPSTAPVAGAIAEVSATETPDEPKKVNKVQERINQLTREKHEERQRNVELEQRLAKLEAEKPAAKAPELVAPDEDNFDTHAEYQTANARFVAETAAQAAYDRIKAEKNSETEGSQRSQREQELKDKRAAFDSNVESKRANFEDFENVAYGHIFMDQDLAVQIFEMDKGPEVAYHLGAHLDVAERIFALPPVQRARELTKLEFQVEALKPKRVSSAPDPITTLGGSERIQQDPEKMTADEWRIWRNKQVHG